MEAPKRIYLQISPYGGDDLSSYEITWCVDRINDTDVEYVRRDVAAKLRVALMREWLGLDKLPEDEMLGLIDETAWLAEEEGNA